MAQLPRFDPAEVATKSDFSELRSDFSRLRSDFSELRSATRSDLAELRSELRDGLAFVNQRLDRLFLTLLVGMFGMLAALIGVIFRIG